ncbi:unnamed protein product [Cladocopium goreaui]|uniref:Uncharacterized protein n=1 Tax=Cladocopium goreaui TaxID=2562237 RepID=A0A9P1BT89_9DINO|nr:unnamed protein product [Cladocopium goreaui]
MAALDAKLRRQQRKVLLQVLVRAKGDKAVFKKEVEHLSKKSRKNTLKVEKGFYTKENMRKVLGWNAKRIKDAVRYCTVKSRVKTHVRRDKYERDLKEYWVDTATTGTFENEHEESLVDRTSTEGIASSFDLGLPAAPDGIEDQGDESEAESTSGNEAPSVRSKVPKPDDLENEPVFEAVENIKTVVDNLLRVQSRLDTLREKLTALNTSESQQCLPKVDAYRSKLEKRHDELADLKSYFDGHMKASDGEEPFEKAKVSQLQTLLRSIEVECMPQTFSLSMEVVSYLHLPYLQDIPRFDGRYKAEEVQTILKPTKPPKGDEPGANAPSGSGKRPRAKAPAKKRKAAVAEPSEPAKKPKIKKKKAANCSTPQAVASSHGPVGPAGKAVARAIAKGVTEKEACHLVQAFWEEFEPLLKPDSIVPSGNFCALASRLARTDHENRLSSHLPKFGLCTNIPVSFVDVGLSETHPILAVSDFIKTLDADNKMDTLLMGNRAQQYEEFWNYWRQLVCCYDYGIFGCNSFEEHLSTVFAELKQFCARNSLQLHMMHLSRQLLGFTKSSEYPIGNWFKGADTVSLLKFLEMILPEKLLDASVDEETNNFFQACLKATREANRFMTTLYHAAFWLTRSERRTLIVSGTKFTTAFRVCADHCYWADLTRFKLQPKQHMFGELVFELQVQECQNLPSPNPLVYSTQQDEDYVGRICTYSRSVSIRTIHVRTLSRYQIALATLI